MTVVETSEVFLDGFKDLESCESPKVTVTSEVTVTLGDSQDSKSLKPSKKTSEVSTTVKRTLTNLYNGRPTWLELAHKKLDDAVFAAYGWENTLSDEEILERLLALNLERAK